MFKHRNLSGNLCGPDARRWQGLLLGVSGHWGCRQFARIHPPSGQEPRGQMRNTLNLHNFIGNAEEV